MTGFVLLHTLLCAALFWASFCRSVHTSSATRREIRVAIWLQAMASIFAGAAPWLGSYRPTWPALLLLASMVLVQGVTSLLWRGGAPLDFQKRTSP